MIAMMVRKNQGEIEAKNATLPSSEGGEPMRWLPRGCGRMSRRRG